MDTLLVPIKFYSTAKEKDKSYIFILEVTVINIMKLKISTSEVAW